MLSLLKFGHFFQFQVLNKHRNIVFVIANANRAKSDEFALVGIIFMYFCAAYIWLRRLQI